MWGMDLRAVRENVTMTTDPNVATREIVRVDMGRHKVALESLADARGLRLSQLVRAVLVNEISAATRAGELSEASRPFCGALEGAPRRRCELRIPKSAHEAVSARAAERGFTFQGYVAALIRAHLDRSPRLGAVELALLRESNARLTAMVQALRAVADAPPSLECDVREHLSIVRALILRNQETWTT